MPDQSIPTIQQKGTNVGIGTANPQFAGGGGLQINTNGTDTRLHLTNTTTGVTGTDGFELALVGNDIYYDSKESSGAQIFYTAGSERMRITNGGSVAIGTSSVPSTNNKIVIQGNGNTNDDAILIFNNNFNANSYTAIGSYYANGNTNVYSQIRFGNETFTGGGAFLAFATGNSERMRITSGGLVGIGTTSPAQRLDVSGNIRATGTQFYLGATASGDTVITMYSQNNSYSEIRSNAGAGGGYNGIMISSNTNAANSLPTWAIDLGGCLNSTSNVNAYTLGYRPNGGSWSSYMVVNSSGNVGIATTSINVFRLNVAGHYSAETGSYATDGGGDSYRAGIGWQSTANPSAVLSTLITTVNDGNYGGNILFLNRGTNGGNLNERMRISSGGNVGIGTTSPICTLDLSDSGAVISGTATVGSNMKGLRVYNTTSATQNNAVGIWFSTGPHQAGIASFRANPASTWETTLAFYTHVDAISNLNDATEKMRITGNGLVGIGTTTPGTALEVFSRAADADRTIPHNVLTITAEQGNAPYGFFGGSILFKNRSYVSGLVNSARIRSVIYDDGAPNNFGGGIWLETTPTPGGTLTPSFVLNYQGRVGIGTTTPARTLDVNGEIRTRTGTIDFSNDFNNQIYVLSNAMTIKTNGSDRVTIDSAGRITQSLSTGAAAFGNGINISTQQGTYTTGHGGILQFQNEDVITAGIRGIRTTGWGSAMLFYVHNESAGNTFGTTFVERMRITETGEIWMGYTSDQGAYLLQVNGSVYASSYFEASDIRLKTVLNRHQSTDFDAIEYKWNDERDNKLHWGYVAQEVMKVLPDAVSGTEDKFYTLDYNQVHTYKIAMLEKEIAELKKQLKQK